jgi:predicted dehydrogenase
VTADYKELVACKDVDVVHVCTPNRSHSEISCAALRAGKDVLCEKPMAINAAEAKAMVEAAKESGRTLSIGYQNRYRADSQYVKAEAEDGFFGDIYYARAYAIRRRAVPTWGVFLNEYEQGGGPLIDIGTHALDLTLWLMDNHEPKMVVGTSYKKLGKQVGTANAWGDWDTEKFTVEDSAFGFVVMKNGATVSVESSWALNIADPMEATVMICGDKGGADTMGEDDLRINFVKNGRQVIETPNFDCGGVAFSYFKGYKGKRFFPCKGIHSFQ